MARLQQEINRHAKQSDESYTKKENTEQYRQRVTAEIAAIRGEEARTLEQIRRLRVDVLTKESYQGRHEAFVEDIKRVSTRIDELRRDFGGAYTLSDKIKELQEQLKLLQMQTRPTAVRPIAKDNGQ